VGPSHHVRIQVLTNPTAARLRRIRVQDALATHDAAARVRTVGHPQRPPFHRAQRSIGNLCVVAGEDTRRRDVDLGGGLDRPGTGGEVDHLHHRVAGEVHGVAVVREGGALRPLALLDVAVPRVVRMPEILIENDRVGRILDVVGNR